MDLELNDLLDDDTHSDTEEHTASEVLEILEAAWMNEKFSPEILPHKIEFVDCMLDQIQCMRSNIETLPKNDMKADIHRLELERIRFVITSYLRCRLKKVEQFAFYLLEQEAARPPEERYLTPAEYQYASEYSQNMDSHLDSVMKEMPQNLQTLATSNKRIRPDLNDYVFLKSKKVVPNVIVRDVFENREEDVELHENSQHLLPYNSISDYVKDGSVQLI